jgi:hypothetical protein
VNNPLRILTALDAHLKKLTRIVIYGRSALALGYPDGEQFAVTMDVDGILPETEMTAIEADDQFWTAVDLTNRELEPSGLYITHLFSDSQVILRPDWLDHIVQISCGLTKLSIYRPHVLDLILTKMMREDPQDLADIRFLLDQEAVSRNDLIGAFDQARVPAIEEIRIAFTTNKQRVLDLPGSS